MEVIMQDFKLKNKNKTVLTFSINRGIFQNVRVECKNLLPYALYARVNLTGENIKYWLERRCIAEARPNLDKFMHDCKCTEKYVLALKNHALSLADSYWIEKEEEHLDWNQINLFKNEYSNNIGLHLLGVEDSPIKGTSPDICTNGVQPKIWLKENDENYLYKFSKTPFDQEPFNEVICSEIALAFRSLTSVEYTLAKFRGKYASKCKSFIAEGVEYVPALYLYNKKEDAAGNMFMSLIRKFKDLNIVNAEDFMYEMTVFDAIINNTDRNLGNFGLLRDTDTGEFICMAPIFDNGNSMWFDERAEMINGEAVRVQPMDLDYKEMFNFVKRANVDFELLEYEVQKSNEFLRNNIEEERAKKINESIIKRMDDARSLINQIKQRNKEKYLGR